MRIDRRAFFSFCARLLPVKLVARWWYAQQARAGEAEPELDQVEAGTDALSFLVVGDWGRRGADHQREVAACMAGSASRLSASFILSTGDNFYENGVDSVHDRQWRLSFEEVYAAPALQVPWYSVLGNHDYQGQPQAQVDYSASHGRWRLPERSYTLAQTIPGSGEARFFFLDTSPFVTEYRLSLPLAIQLSGQNPKDQLRWLDRALAESKESWKIVVAHHPIFSGGEHGNQPELVDQVLPLLRKHGVQVYLNGHDHDLQHVVRYGIHFFTSGAGSQVRQTRAIEGTRFAQGAPGFLAVTLRKSRLQGTFFDAAGTRLYQAIVPRVG